MRPLKELVAEVQSETIQVLSRWIRPGENVALLDFPSHQNVGDSAIWVGQTRYLKQLGAIIRYVADIATYDPRRLRRNLHPGSLVLLTGGGTLGDRWMKAARHRLQVIHDLPDYRILLLPQGVDFSSSDAAETTDRIMGKHPDLHLLVRERLSLARARTLLPSVSTTECPDMAFGLGVMHRMQPQTNSVLALLRRDLERLQPPPTYEALPEGVRVVDWGLHGLYKPLWKLGRSPSLAPQLQRAVRLGFTLTARTNLHAGCRLLSSGNAVITDRLHAMVLAALLGVPVCGLDNSNGKVRAVYEQYLKQLPHVGFAETVDQATQRIRAVTL